MLPIPAIDIQNGKCVRLQKGDLSSTKIYFEKPIDAAAHWIKEGTKRLHLVDLDGAKSGKPENLKYVLEIKKKFLFLNTKPQIDSKVIEENIPSEIQAAGT